MKDIVIQEKFNVYSLAFNIRWVARYSTFFTKKGANMLISIKLDATIFGWIPYAYRLSVAKCPDSTTNIEDSTESPHIVSKFIASKTPNF